ncbi:hypothetical protein EKO27_g555 [Xylaria grammica]|uniref:Uncharacterized protein n=1 Tax=Xylaria grammica TaxID=363999 RepID=A0A439DJC4_9PEZI|nr:hypothetical protein EKO27_g555 [Xylaria grammica]
MVHLLLAPYNDSMQLGQGFNSFLHKPCIDGAVDIPESSLQTQAVKAGGAGNVSQVVSYSSRFVEKISEVVRSMNISAASSIKSGTIEVSGNSLSVDEAKFAASDLNAVISVKVINQTTTTLKNPKFCPLEGVKMNSQRFFEKFGDCYVSGFMEGGDLHGIVSVKVLDATKKSEVESVLKGQMNGAGNSGEFILGEGSGTSAFTAALSQTETTVTVNWSGGGQIKPDTEDWSLDTLVKAAASFPSRVASCPQRTWAILTRYDNNRSFVEWADKHDIEVPDFNRVQQATSDLLDNFMEYKNNLARLNSVMANPAAFKLSPYKDPVGLTVKALVDERKLLKDEMSKISYIIDNLNKDPLQPPLVEIKNPILWACRLPVPIDSVTPGASSVSTADRIAVLGGFAFVNDPISSDSPSGGAPIVAAPVAAPLESAVKSAIDNVAQNTTDMAKDLKGYAFAPLPPANITTPGLAAEMSPADREWVNDDENKRAYAEFRFDRHTGSDSGGRFNDAIELKKPMVPVTWPQRIEIRMLSWGGHNIARSVDVVYDQLRLSHGSEGTVIDSLIVHLVPGEKINRIRLGAGPETWGVKGVAFAEIYTTSGQVCRIGDEDGHHITDYYPFDGADGFKGWWGSAGDVIDQLAPIWGH